MRCFFLAGCNEIALRLGHRLGHYGVSGLLRPPQPAREYIARELVRARNSDSLGQPAEGMQRGKVRAFVHHALWPTQVYFLGQISMWGLDPSAPPLGVSIDGQASSQQLCARAGSTPFQCLWARSAQRTPPLALGASRLDGAWYCPLSDAPTSSCGRPVGQLAR